MVKSPCGELMLGIAVIIYLAYGYFSFLECDTCAGLARSLVPAMICVESVGLENWPIVCFVSRPSVIHGLA